MIEGNMWEGFSIITNWETMNLCCLLTSCSGSIEYTMCMNQPLLVRGYPGSFCCCWFLMHWPSGPASSVIRMNQWVSLPLTFPSSYSSTLTCRLHLMLLSPAAVSHCHEYISADHWFWFRHVMSAECEGGVHSAAMLHSLRGLRKERKGGLLGSPSVEFMQLAIISPHIGLGWNDRKCIKWVEHWQVKLYLNIVL